MEFHKTVIRRLLELNAHDFSEFDGRAIGPHAEYGYRYLDHYWTDPDRHPYLIDVDGELAGCALVRSGEPHEMAEFFTLRKHRRRGVGLVGARTIFPMHPGEWLVHESTGNDAALSFWRRAIPYEFTEESMPSGTTQSFHVPAGG